MNAKKKDRPRTEQEIFEDLVKIATTDQGDFVAELENLVGKKLSTTILKKGISQSAIIEYLRTTYMTRNVKISHSIKMVRSNIGKNASVGSF